MNLAFDGTRNWTWIERLIAAVTALALMALAFFFIVAFIVVGSAVALALYIRWRWLSRDEKLARQHHTIEGEYQVIEHAKDSQQDSRA
jgi:membrane protein implicated in regulation of membrane protease activity